jgi:chlorite dismutase
VSPWRWKDHVANGIKVTLDLLHSLNAKADLIMATLQETEAKLATIEATLTKASAEITAEIATLQGEIAAAGQSTPGMDASIGRIQAIADALDALNPDVVAPPAP